jgi:hypothetical protein
MEVVAAGVFASAAFYKWRADQVRQPQERIRREQMLRLICTTHGLSTDGSVEQLEERLKLGLGWNIRKLEEQIEARISAMSSAEAASPPRLLTDDRPKSEIDASAAAFRSLQVREKHELAGSYVATSKDNWSLVSFDEREEFNKKGFIGGGVVVRWVVMIDQKAHWVELVHGLFTGTKRVYAENSALVHESTTFLDEGGIYPLPVMLGSAQVAVHIDIDYDGFWQYDLSVDGTKLRKLVLERYKNLKGRGVALKAIGASADGEAEVSELDESFVSELDESFVSEDGDDDS